MMKKWLALALKIAVSGGLIWYLVGKNDMAQVRASLAGADPMLMALAAAMLLFQMVIAGFRWGAVLRAIGVEIPFWEVVRLFYIGAFFNQALPGGTGGDAVRIYMVYKSDVGLRGAFNGVVLERVATVLALVLLVLAGMVFFVDRLDAAGRAWVVPSIGVVALGAFVGVGVLCALDRLPESLRQWRVVRGLGHLATDARAVFLKPVNAFKTLAWSAAGHLNVAMCAYALAMALDLTVTAFDCIVLMPPVLLIMTIPVSVGGWGVREAAMVVAFGLVGVSKEGATVLGFLLGLAGLAVAIPGGLMWLSSRRRGRASLADMEAELAAAGEGRPT
ncbi:MAG: lysylphosphatidylglycerol synthase transmembrane domain-containing protein [Rhodospirillaceae bacterium]